MAITEVHIRGRVTPLAKLEVSVLRLIECNESCRLMNMVLEMTTQGDLDSLTKFDFILIDKRNLA